MWPIDFQPEHSLQAGNLRVGFQRQADRWRHVIFFDADDNAECFAASLEGTAEQNWPSSPSIQELHFETHGNRRVAMGVGMSGSSHWSLCVSADSQSQTLLFELACRTKSVPEFLGSTYILKTLDYETSPQLILLKPTTAAQQIGFHCTVGEMFVQNVESTTAAAPPLWEIGALEWQSVCVQNRPRPAAAKLGAGVSLWLRKSSRPFVSTKEIVESAPTSLGCD